MKKVCIIILISLIALLTADVITTGDTLIFVILFISLYNLQIYIGKYLKARREKKQIDYFMKVLEKCIERQNTQLTATYQQK